MKSLLRICKKSFRIHNTVSNKCRKYEFFRPPPPRPSVEAYTDKKEYKIFLIFKEIQNGAVAKSFMTKGFLIYEEMRKYLTIYEEEAVSHI